MAMPLNLVAQRAPFTGVNWRSLHFFNVYRLTLASILLAVAVAFGTSFSFGSQNNKLFTLGSGGYIAFSVLSAVLISMRRPSFNTQLSVQVSADVVFTVILLFASGGIGSGLGLLLFASLAGAGLLSRGRLSMFHAALAALAILLEHTYRVVFLYGDVAQYAQAGMTSVGYFAAAWVAHALAKYTQASEQLAAQRGIDFANLAQANQLVIQDMQDGVLVVDARGVIRQRNARAEEMLGVIAPGQRELSLEIYAPALAQRWHGWRSNASVRMDPLRSTISNKLIDARFVQADKDRQAGAVIFLEDLSRIQAQVQQMKLASLGRLTANIAHEIRNPLSSISHATELLQEEQNFGDTQLRLLQIIRDNTQRLDRMVQDVLKLNRRDRAHTEIFSLGEYLRTFIEQFCRIEKIPLTIFSLEVEDEYLITFDRSHLNQVMWNLCRNALRHCMRQDKSIRLIVNSGEADSVVEFTVVDDGVGVVASIRGQLFEPFVTTVSSGTGLGLYIARETCEANNATLEYVETDGGAKFMIRCKEG